MSENLIEKNLPAELKYIDQLQKEIIDTQRKIDYLQFLSNYYKQNFMGSFAFSSSINTCDRQILDPSPLFLLTQLQEQQRFCNLVWQDMLKKRESESRVNEMLLKINYLKQENLKLAEGKHTAQKAETTSTKTAQEMKVTPIVSFHNLKKRHLDQQNFSDCPEPIRALSTDHPKIPEKKLRSNLPKQNYPSILSRLESSKSTVVTHYPPLKNPTYVFKTNYLNDENLKQLQLAAQNNINILELDKLLNYRIVYNLGPIPQEVFERCCKQAALYNNTKMVNRLNMFQMEFPSTKNPSMIFSQSRDSSQANENNQKENLTTDSTVFPPSSI